MTVAMPIGVIDWAKAYARDGRTPLPLRPKEKVPRIKNWTSTSVTDTGLEHTFHEGDNIGLLLGHQRNLVDVVAMRWAPE